MSRRPDDVLQVAEAEDAGTACKGLIAYLRHAVEQEAQKELDCLRRACSESVISDWGLLWVRWIEKMKKVEKNLDDNIRTL